MQKHFAAVCLFFCVGADAYSHAVGILVWPLSVYLLVSELNNAKITVKDFSTTVLSG